MSRRGGRLKTATNTTKHRKVVSNYVKPNRIGTCKRCNQNLADVCYFGTNPSDFQTESDALKDTKLVSYSSTVKGLKYDEFITYKVTSFTMYCPNYHLCSIDLGLIEKGVPMRFAGLISPVDVDDPNRLRNGTAAWNCGPISEWFTDGYDGGDVLCIGFTTKKAAYYLMEPSEEYKQIYEPFYKKIQLTRVVIQFLLDKYWENPDYADLIQQIEICGKYPNAEETLLTNAEFICQRVNNYDEKTPSDEKPLISLECMETLQKLSVLKDKRLEGISEKNDNINKKVKQKASTTKESAQFKVVATETVRHIFKDLFSNQDDRESNEINAPTRCSGISKSSNNHTLETPTIKGRVQSKIVATEATCRPGTSKSGTNHILETPETNERVQSMILATKTVKNISKESFSNKIDEESNKLHCFVEHPSTSKRSSSHTYETHSVKRSIKSKVKTRKGKKCKNSFSNKVRLQSNITDSSMVCQGSSKSSNNGTFVRMPSQTDEPMNTGPQPRQKQIQSNNKSDATMSESVDEYKGTVDYITEDESEDEEPGTVFQKMSIKYKFLQIPRKVTWERSPMCDENNNCLCASVGDITINVGDYVLLNPEDPNEMQCIVKVIYMYENTFGSIIFHGEFLCKSKNTILGETGDPLELFFVDDCVDLPLSCVLEKMEVYALGSIEAIMNFKDEVRDRVAYYVNKRFLVSRFEDLDFDLLEDHGNCRSCRMKMENELVNTPRVKNLCVTWKKQEFHIGTGVFLTPGVYKFPYTFSDSMSCKTSDTSKNNIVYPEYYRKQLDDTRPTFEVSEPFTIGLIEDIEETTNDIMIKVRIFYRPENTANGMFLSYQKDLNYVYYTAKVETLSFKTVVGKCYIKFGDELSSIRKWSQEGEHRFYFMKMYDIVNKRYQRVPNEARGVGSLSFLAGYIADVPPAWIVPNEPLSSLDLFAGCGGLSEGLHQVGLAETKWAVEIDPITANAYRKNFPNCSVIQGDCNKLLHMLLQDNYFSNVGLPEKGEVDLLIAGPPCQGFSCLNRFSNRKYSSFQNSLIMTFLGYCEYYLPKYILFENVRNFVSFNNGLVLKLTLKCLLALGYQVTYGVLQAGQYFIPQSRRRFILMAAYPGNPLPKFPEPLNVFSKQGNHLNFVVDNMRYDNGCEWLQSAPFRMVTVRDALTDLPDIENGDNEYEKPYYSEPISHFQRLMRRNADYLVKDHVCKPMGELALARIKNIPLSPGADWRDLPNISYRLPSGTLVTSLDYPYRFQKQDEFDIPQGVCSCATGESCNPSNRQTNTLIPWCLPHTANRNNQWSGIYGRIEWGGYFCTTVTNPEPMGKQGRVIHPDQNRVVSIRECARSQGFPDKFIFTGSILDKHRQIGNAVPPPLAAALGRQICKALATKREFYN